MLLSGLGNLEQNLSKNQQKLNQKRQKLRNFDITGQFEALFFYELNLSRNESSPKQQVCPRLKRLNTVVHEVYRYIDKKWKKRNLTIFRNFVFFDVDSGQFPIEKLHLSLF